MILFNYVVFKLKLLLRGFDISFLDDPLVSKIIFYPRKSKVPDNLPSHIHVFRLQLLNNIKLGGFCFIKNRNLPTILLFHGNGEIALDYIHLYELFFKCDVNLAVVDYRGYGFSSGKPFYSKLLSDAYPIYQKFKEWMREQELKASLFIMGRSLGSVCASEIGAQNPPELRGIIFESGFSSLYNMMTHLFRIGGITHESVQEYSNDTRMAKIQKPVLIIHGTNDQIFPYSEADLIFKSLPENNEISFVPIIGAGHNNLFDCTNEYIPPLRKFIKKYNEEKNI